MIIFQALKEVAFVVQSRWESLWETDRMCLKGNLKCALKNINKVINKPNYSKFRRMADDTDWETQVRMAAEAHAPQCACSTRGLSTCCSVATHYNTTTFCCTRTSGWTDCERLSPEGFGQVRNTHGQQQQQSPMITFPKDHERQKLSVLSVKNTNPESLQIWLGFTVFGSKAICVTHMA